MISIFGIWLKRLHEGPREVPPHLPWGSVPLAMTAMVAPSSMGIQSYYEPWRDKIVTSATIGICTITGPSKCVRFAPFHPRALLKGRHFTDRTSRYTISIGVPVRQRCPNPPLQKHLEDFGFHCIGQATFLRQLFWSCKDTKIQELSSIIKERALTADKGQAPMFSILAGGFFWGAGVLLHISER